MALEHYQQTALAVSGTTLLGGYAMAAAGTVGTTVSAATSGMFETATTFGSSCTILGIGNLTGFTENLEFTTTQAGNSNEPDKAVAGHTLTITFDLLEFYPPNWDIIRGTNLDTSVVATAGSYIGASPGTSNIFSTGGLSAVDARAFAFYNTKMVAGVTVATIIIVHKARVETGLTFTPKSDHDTDPVMVTPITLTGELDTTRDAGNQLFFIETEMGA